MVDNKFPSGGIYRTEWGLIFPGYSNEIKVQVPFLRLNVSLS